MGPMPEVPILRSGIGAKGCTPGMGLPSSSSCVLFPKWVRGGSELAMTDREAMTIIKKKV